MFIFRIIDSDQKVDVLLFPALFASYCGLTVFFLFFSLFPDVGSNNHTAIFVFPRRCSQTDLRSGRIRPEPGLTTETRDALSEYHPAKRREHDHCILLEVRQQGPLLCPQ